MVHRTPAHELEDLAKARLLELFVRAGWTVEDLAEDYGEDFFVRIFDNGTATPFAFFVQSKATGSLTRLISRNSAFVSYPVATKHLEHWDRFWEPVVLTLFDASTGTIYWRVIQNWMAKQTEQRRNNLNSQDTASVRIPLGNVLDSTGIERLRKITVERFERFENEQEGANHLIGSLKEKLGLEISYNAQNGILTIPNGEFIPDTEGGESVFFFGKTLVLLDEMAEAMGLTYQEVLSTSIAEAYQRVTAMPRSDVKRLVRELDDDDDA